jgi:hypothetical protein
MTQKKKDLEEKFPFEKMTVALHKKRIRNNGPTDLIMIYDMSTSIIVNYVIIESVMALNFVTLFKCQKVIQSQT